MTKKIFVIAGEASGDALGGPLIEALREREPGADIRGVGGEQMQAAGLNSLMPMEELCVMGLVEVAEHLPRLLKLIKNITAQIEAFNPDVVVTIDLPDFNFRVAKLLKKNGVCDAKIIHYVAPTVWAWREGRAKKVAQFLDGLMCLFPFEPAYFTPHGLKADFVGHSLIEKDRSEVDGAAFRARNGIEPDAKVLAVMFGSRQGEFKTHAPIFAEALRDIQEQEPSLQIVVPTLPHLNFAVMELISELGIPAYVVLDDGAKMDAIAAADAAMAVSGTVGLELAYSKVPHVIAYKASFVTWVMLKLLVKSKFAHLANILLDRAAVPEFLQWSCSPGKLAAGVLELFQDEEAKAAQLTAFDEIREKLGNGDVAPSKRAAAVVLDN